MIDRVQFNLNLVVHSFFEGGYNRKKNAEKDGVFLMRWFT